jgi:transposase InsO family protein
VLGLGHHNLTEEETLMVHPRATLTPRGRLLLVRRVEELSWPAAQVAEAAGVSRATVYKWLGRFRTEGQAGLQDRSSRPKRSPRALSAEQIARIVKLRRGLKRGPHRLAPLLGHPRSTIYAVLRRQGCARLRDFDRVTGRPLRYVRQHPGELVHVDVKKLGVVPPGGGKRFLGATLAARRQRHRGHDCIYVAVDDATRVAFVRVFADQSEGSAIQFVQATYDFFARYGVRVERIMTDQHRAFRTSKAFHAALAALGIRHVLTRPYRPQTNGKAERFIQTLLADWAYLRLFRNNAERLRALPRWVDFYNQQRPHSELGNQPPWVVFVNNVRGNHS